ncbi:MAG: phosphate acyltransferase PlsX [Eubacteriales bacterium]|nr:phosphate acyltransferase PlsX [Eubacteriales bacterium]
MKIVLDVFGGDYAPKEIVLGMIGAINADKDIEVVAVGDETKINEVLNEQKFKSDRVTIVDAKDVITNDESPTMAIKLKKESSLVKAFDYLMANDDAVALVSAGSTGAVLTGAFMKAGRIKGVSRPALAPILPTVKHGGVVLCDCGANVDCKAVNLLHFGIMGAAFAGAMLKIENPKIGLLSNGAEDKKGNELCHEAFALLKESGLNFAGNCEARDILSGEYDVIVADGFNGNIALKSAEGTANAVFGLLKEGIKNGGLRAKLGAGLLLPTLKKLKKEMDYNENGGACFLGVNKVVVKSHGASKAKSITASILQAKDLAKFDVVGKIADYIGKIDKRDEE